MGFSAMNLLMCGRSKEIEPIDRDVPKEPRGFFFCMMSVRGVELSVPCYLFEAQYLIGISEEYM